MSFLINKELKISQAYLFTLPLLLLHSLPPSPSLPLLVKLVQQMAGLEGRIAYHGGAGSRGEELASSLHPEMELLPCASYDDVFLALASFATEKALVPIEDSLGGSIQEVLDLFLR